MATLQGICKNCGSLIMFSDRDSECECVFCNCVFPSAEAVEIMENPDGREYPNEKYEPSTDTKRHTTTRVYSDESIKKAIMRDELKEANSSEPKLKPSEFEVSPKDVKAPAKTMSIVIGAFALAIILIIAIATPLHSSRTKLLDKIEDKYTDVYAGIYEDDYSLGYTIWGQNCEHIKVLTSAAVSEDSAKQMFDNYCAIRSEAGGKSGSSDVTMEIYSAGCIWTVTSSSAERVEDKELKDVEETVESTDAES